MTKQRTSVSLDYLIALELAVDAARILSASQYKLSSFEHRALEERLTVAFTVVDETRGRRCPATFTNTEETD